jgi:hypothetical protein
LFRRDSFIVGKGRGRQEQRGAEDPKNCFHTLAPESEAVFSALRRLLLLCRESSCTN